MTNEELQNIIDQLDKLDSKEAASFNILQQRDNTDEILVKANKQGLVLFAKQLLKTAQDANETVDGARTFIIVELNEKDEAIIQYQGPVRGTGNEGMNKPGDNKETLTDKLLPFGCVAVILLGMIALVAGFWTLFKWIF